MTTSSIDILFDVRNNYYIGAFQQCINDSQNVKVKLEEDILEKSSYLYRAYIALNKTSIPLSEIDPTTNSASLRAIRRFAEYTAHPDKRSKIIKDVEKELDGELNETSLLMNAFILLQEENIDDALRILSRGNSLECQSTTVQCLLKINRPDLASKVLKKMQEIDEDCTITQLTLAWVNMTIGKEKLKDAFYIYQEMIEKFGATPSLLVSQAACLIQQQKYEDAEKLLQDAMQRDSGNPEAIIGLLVASQFLAKSAEVTNRYINQLKQDFPNHSWTKNFLNKEKEFEQLVQ